MKKRLFIYILIASAIAFLIIACQPVSLRNQRATATAYAVSFMTDAMAAAENGAMALCNIDFEAGKNAYLENVCAVSTRPGCEYYRNKIADSWRDLDRSYTSNRLGCVKGTSRFLEVGNQFGMNVQYWQISLQGTEGWGADSGSREYWLQVAEENSAWMLNRVLTGDEVAFYLTIEAMAGEE